MKAEVKIPKGWRRLRRGEVLRQTDRCFDEVDMWWCLTSLAGTLVGDKRADCEPYIRPQKKKPATPNRRSPRHAK